MLKSFRRTAVRSNNKSGKEFFIMSIISGIAKLITGVIVFFEPNALDEFLWIRAILGIFDLKK